eukprot:CAMPEP_0115862046 /NCGR_PEP_ID=MMETSP0287-20121206/17973_1 /TAXON_ID=412157 /ORGANISM="Chrysochromulina rotalis, Strain UIO044" /LENGTH=196 /DNA_ID=CAMNT_0003316453 /DNA_START=247 /DNA_END=839 /DNA_ORIENTATION=+
MASVKQPRVSQPTAEVPDFECLCCKCKAALAHRAVLTDGAVSSTLAGSVLSTLHGPLASSHFTTKPSLQLRDIDIASTNMQAHVASDHIDWVNAEGVLHVLVFPDQGHQEEGKDESHACSCVSHLDPRHRRGGNHQADHRQGERHEDGVSRPHHDSNCTLHRPSGALKSEAVAKTVAKEAMQSVYSANAMVHDPDA